MPRPPLYQIVDFSDTFENYKSRTIDRCSWFANPNDLDIQWANLMSQGVHGAAIFGIFQSLLKVCSRQHKPRLGFLTHDGRCDGQRYTVAELAMVLYQTEDLVAEALASLASPDVHWLAIVDPASDTQGPREDTTRIPQGQSEDTTRIPRGAREDHASPPNGYHEVSVIEGRNRRKEGTPIIPQRGIVDISVSDAQKWLNSFFGRQEHWSYEELSLLSELLPIPKQTRALLSWAYKLPRDKEGWAIANDRRLSKPKQSLLVLLREFQSEVDKWRTVRSNLNGSRPAEDVPVPPEWVVIGKQIYGAEWEPPPCMRLLPVSVEQDIKEELERHASAAA